MAIPQLEESIQFYFGKGLAATSIRSYSSARNRYLKFCKDFKLTSFPLCELNLCGFAAFLAEEHLKHQTIKCYLSGLRYFQITMGMHDPFGPTKDMPRLEYLLKGIRSVQARAGFVPRPRLPITPEIMVKLLRVWDTPPLSTDKRMLWAACCLAFFGFLRIGEMSVPAGTVYSATDHLSVGDICFDHHQDPSRLFVTIKQSKTDPFRQGVTLVLGRTFSPLCPVAAMASYLAVRGFRAGPLFRLSDGTPLSRNWFVKHVHSALTTVGLDHSVFNGHSFRIGAATAAARRGIEDSVIKILGRWESAAYQQ